MTTLALIEAIAGESVALPFTRGRAHGITAPETRLQMKRHLENMICAVAYLATCGVIAAVAVGFLAPV